MVRLLHTADWHLGKTLHGQRRVAEFEKFLAWLHRAIIAEQVDVLLIAGDVFDSGTPGTRSLELYHQFLADLQETPCQHVVIIGGNHDSPSLLEASAAVLRRIDVHVVGAAKEDPADEVILLKDRQDQPCVLVAAVPFLRDQEIRLSTADESHLDKDRKLVEAMTEHYREVAEVASRINQSLSQPVPVIGMGHLFVAGVARLPTREEGVRDLYIGTLGQVPVDIFPDAFDYIALGHLHVEQRVAGREDVRYSGSPIPMGFGEADGEKAVLLVDLLPDQLTVTPKSIPIFQTLKRLHGDWHEIEAGIHDLTQVRQEIWLEVVYEGPDCIADLDERIDRLIQDSSVKVLKVLNRQVFTATLDQAMIGRDLEELQPIEVFQMRMALDEITPPQQARLMEAYREILERIENEAPPP